MSNSATVLREQKRLLRARFWAALLMFGAGFAGGPRAVAQASAGAVPTQGTAPASATSPKSDDVAVQGAAAQSPAPAADLPDAPMPVGWIAHPEAAPVTNALLEPVTLLPESCSVAWSNY